MKKCFFWLTIFLFCGNLSAIILIIDFGSPISPYIKYYLQGAYIPCVEYDHTVTAQEIIALNPKGIILSGSPAPVCKPGSPTVPALVFTLGVPVFGICYGQQLMCAMLGGTVEHNAHPEQGPTLLHVTEACRFTEGIWCKGETVEIWMGHEDRIAYLPPGFKTIAHTAGSPHAVIVDEVRKFFGVQFHPEAPLCGWPELLEHFAFSVVGEQPDPSIIQEPLATDERALYKGLLHGCCCTQ